MPLRLPKGVVPRQFNWAAKLARSSLVPLSLLSQGYINIAFCNDDRRSILPQRKRRTFDVGGKNGRRMIIVVQLEGNIEVGLRMIEM
jgi:hypothetical protein